MQWDLCVTGFSKESAGGQGRVTLRLLPVTRGAQKDEEGDEEAGGSSCQTSPQDDLRVSGV